MIYPIGFSIPKEKIVNKVPKKEKVLATIIPGNLDTYIFNDEQSYYEDYQTSNYALTTKKGGWDCLRHYEILANGCIPIFPKLQECPPTTMTFLPKELIQNANNDIQNYYLYACKLLDYTKQHLTTEAMSSYILEITGNKEAKSVLFLSGFSVFASGVDYLRCLTLHGFKSLFKDRCHEYPCIEHLYTDFGDTTNLYGKGFSCSKLLDKKIYRNSELDKDIRQDILSKKYDLIVYGSIHRGMPYFDNVSATYSPSKVVLMCGEDIHTHQPDKCPLFLTWFKENHCFIREL